MNRKGEDNKNETSDISSVVFNANKSPEGMIIDDALNKPTTNPKYEMAAVDARTISDFNDKLNSLTSPMEELMEPANNSVALVNIKADKTKNNHIKNYIDKLMSEIANTSIPIDGSKLITAQMSERQNMQGLYASRLLGQISDADEYIANIKEKVSEIEASINDDANLGKDSEAVKDEFRKFSDKIIKGLEKTSMNEVHNKLVSAFTKIDDAYSVTFQNIGSPWFILVNLFLNPANFLFFLIDMAYVKYNIAELKQSNFEEIPDKINFLLPKIKFLEQVRTKDKPFFRMIQPGYVIDGEMQLVKEMVKLPNDIEEDIRNMARNAKDIKKLALFEKKSKGTISKIDVSKNTGKLLIMTPELKKDQENQGAIFTEVKSDDYETTDKQIFIQDENLISAISHSVGVNQKNNTDNLGGKPISAAKKAMDGIYEQAQKAKIIDGINNLINTYFTKKCAKYQQDVTSCISSMDSAVTDLEEAHKYQAAVNLMGRAQSTLEDKLKEIKDNMNKINNGVVAGYRDILRNAASCLDTLVMQNGDGSLSMNSIIEKNSGESKEDLRAINNIITKLNLKYDTIPKFCQAVHKDLFNNQKKENIDLSDVLRFHGKTADSMADVSHLDTLVKFLEKNIQNIETRKNILQKSLKDNLGKEVEIHDNKVDARIEATLAAKSIAKAAGSGRRKDRGRY